MSWSVVGTSTSHSDNATFTTGSPTNVTMTPPGSMTSGDLVFVSVGNRYNSTWTVGVTGGQTWNALAQHTYVNSVMVQGFWCIYNGTWAANPQWTPSTGSLGCGLQMAVYRYSAAATITQDAAQTTDGNASNPSVINHTGVTTTVDDGLVLQASYISVNRTFTISGTGWANPGGAQLRSLGAGALATGWLNAGTAGAVANCVQTANNSGNQGSIMVSFKATVASSDSARLVGGSLVNGVLSRGLLAG